MSNPAIAGTQRRIAVSFVWRYNVYRYIARRYKPAGTGRVNPPCFRLSPSSAGPVRVRAGRSASRRAPATARPRDPGVRLDLALLRQQRPLGDDAERDSEHAAAERDRRDHRLERPL